MFVPSWRGSRHLRPVGVAGVLLASSLILGCGGEKRASTKGGSAPAAAQGAGGYPSAPAPAKEHVGGGTATVRLALDWGPSLLPFQIRYGRHEALIGAAYDSLLTFDAAAKIHPYLAESYTETPDSVTFTLRKDVKCADGTPLTASVVKNSLIASLTSEGTAMGAYSGPGPFTVTGDDAAFTVEVKSGKPWNDLSRAFALGQSGIVCPAGLAKGADVATKTYGTGPFVAENVVPGKSITMKRHEGWTWGPLGNTFESLPETLQFNVVESDSTAANLLSTGGLDIAWVGGSDVARLERDESLLNFTNQGVSINLLTLNNDREPFKSNPKLREALFTALDREAITNASFGAGNGVVASSVFGDATECHSDVSSLIPKFDPAKAKTLLREAGYTEEAGKWVKDGKPLKLLLIGSEITQQNAPELIASQLSDIGVTVDLQMKPTTAFSTDFVSGKFDLAIKEGGTTNPAPSTQAQYLIGKPFTGGGYNLTGTTDDAKLDELMGRATSAPSDARCEVWDEFQKYYAGQHYVIPLGMFIGHHFTRGYDIGAYFPDRFVASTLQKRAR